MTNITKLNKAQLRQVIFDLENKAKDRTLQYVEWTDIINHLTDEEKTELNEAYKKVYGGNYPNIN